jgi:hypothetical protein
MRIGTRAERALPSGVGPGIGVALGSGVGAGSVAVLVGSGVAVGRSVGVSVGRKVGLTVTVGEAAGDKVGDRLALGVPPSDRVGVPIGTGETEGDDCRERAGKMFSPAARVHAETASRNNIMTVPKPSWRAKTSSPPSADWSQNSLEPWFCQRRFYIYKATLDTQSVDTINKVLYNATDCSDQCCKFQL